MSRRHALVVAAALAASLVAWEQTEACLHLPKDYEGSIEQLAQGGLIYYANGREDLILKNSFIVNGQARPESVAWVVPVPSKPLAYSEVEGDVFKAMFDQWEGDKGNYRDRTGAVVGGPPKTRGLSLGGAKSMPKGVSVLETHGVGPYEIAVVQATNAAALNSWLTSNGFGEVPEANMAFYIENGHTWVCVKTTPEGLDGDLKPLRISFNTPTIIYPLKFSSHQGRFNVELYVVTDEPFPFPKLQGPGERISTDARLEGQTGSSFKVEGRWLELPEAPAAIAKELGIENTMGTKLPYVTRVTARQLDGSSVSEWKEDFEITPPAGAEVAPTQAGTPTPDADGLTDKLDEDK